LAEHPDPSSLSAASISPTDQMLDVSLRATLREFASQEGDRMTVNLDRFFEHCRRLGYDLMGAPV
jgi:hypothetical protein